MTSSSKTAVDDFLLYLDSSALVKRYVRESESDAVIARMDDAVAVATSLVTRAEVAAALAQAVRDRRMDDRGAKRAYREFSREWPDLGRVPVTDALVERAGALAWEHGLRGYDAVQLAAALTFQDVIDPLGYGVLFAAFDDRLREAAARAGMKIWPE